ncbi:MAG: hypothetical protein ACF8R7_02990 [Phycisphaerales bacterium JB039]
MPAPPRIAPLLLAAAALAGCNAAPSRVDYARPYPVRLSRAETLNIQVIRQGPEITLTNSTARAFGPSTIWLNSRFSYPIDGLAVGQTITLDLGRFADENSDRFKPGGFFATEIPDLLVLAELETISQFTGEPELLGMIAVGNRRGE